MHNRINLWIGIGLIACVAGALRADGLVPAHPNELNYPTLDFKLPPPGQFRALLSNGMVVYVAESDRPPKK